MAAMSFYRNIHDKRILDRTLFMEMNEAASDLKKDSTFKSEVPQLKDIPCVQLQVPGSNQGSVLSLGSRSIIDQSDVQPLTEIHACRYDECNKFHHKSPREASESPASPLKNSFLFLLIGLLIFWILIYALLSKLKLL